MTEGPEGRRRWLRECPLVVVSNDGWGMKNCDDKGEDCARAKDVEGQLAAGAMAICKAGTIAKPRMSRLADTGARERTTSKVGQ